ncbi:MAG: MBL fold metallo-hydrolase [Candidatus Aminicenantes bacterium]|nr:MBL fold metallo-hydrolase [Candidatus Aminicenantes bacterium]
MGEKTNIRLQIVYDNRALNENFQADWGFSCLVTGLEKSILFDTGANGKILLHNMENLGISPQNIDVVLLSHDHYDHTGGLETLAAKNPRVEVWFPHFFSGPFREKIQAIKTKPVPVEEYQEICPGAFTTGVISGWINEQSLVLSFSKGFILITGCAHPRITRIMEQVREKTQKNLYAVLGGFHLAGFEKNEILEIIQEFKNTGVQKAGPCHCSGDEARKFFLQEYGKDFLDLSAGKEVVFP